MPDWQQYVRSRLQTLDIAGDRLLDLEQELVLHLELAYQDELRRGTDPVGAERKVKRLLQDGRILESELRRTASFAGPARMDPEALVPALGGGLAGCPGDTLLAVRRLGRSPWFSASVVLILALSLGGVAAVGGAIRSLLWAPLPYPDAGRLHLIWRAGPEEPAAQGDSSGPDYLYLKASDTAFEEVAAFSRLGVTLIGGRKPQRLLAALVEPGIFRLLGIAPELGPGLQASDFDTGEGIVISHRLWVEQFGADLSVIGRTLDLSGQTRRVSAVMPASFSFPDARTDAWFPLDPAALERPRYYFLNILGRVRPGASNGQVQESLALLSSGLEQGSSGPKAFLHSRSLLDLETQPVRRPLWILAVGVLLVWLCSCLNLASLFTSRLYQRSQELAVRLALGGDRWRLFRLVALEAWILSLAGALVGLLIAIWVRDFLGSLASSPPHLGEDTWPFLLLLTTLLALISGCLFSLIPLFRLRLVNICRDLNTSRQVAGMRPRSWLVGAQLAVSLVLAVTAALVLGSVWELLAVDPGFNPDRLLAATVVLPPQSYPEDVLQIGFLDNLLAALERNPQIQSVAAASMLPLDGDFWRYRVVRSDHPEDEGDRRPRADYRMVTPGYFAAMGVSLLEGREFDSRDRAPAPRSILVNESLARTFWPGEDPLGKQIEFQFCRPRPCPVVGVVGDVKQFSLTDPEHPAIYASYLQKADADANYFHLAVRSRTADLSSAVSAMRQAVGEFDPSLPLANLIPYAERIRSNLGARPLVGTLLALFTLVAASLSLLGIYSLVALQVSGQRREIAIRLTLGATRNRVVGRVLRRVAVLCLRGLGLGVILSLGARRLVQGLLFSLASGELWIVPLAALALASATLIAAWIPARRAAGIDPAETLRSP